ncbi:hypothetical protein [Pseudoduganella namucuonensis]|uniref:KTSC domain-containing protein n=1 Tax=Pseudoduganella namucuonensis TaxID=1035707 RepID=A0A1I7GWB6_9BURK|nr:hypothetical protein [Pseudoduganella namucuonensis]SFU52721.1 hypothetical protein SAMN05216552_1004156 [Pseudoduganella namucuonensis]
MERYRNKSGKSGVTAYAIGADAIEVRFVGGDVYRYSYASAGRARVEEMKRLARGGEGLSGYIARHARDAYER